MSEIASMSLVEIPTKDWPKLKDIWSIKPIYTPGHQCLSNFINWQEKEPNLDIKILSLNNNWQTYGTFLLIFKSGAKSHGDQLYFNTLNDNLECLTKALQILPATGDQYLLCAYDSRLMPVANAFFKRFPDREIWTEKTMMYHATKEVVSNFKIDAPLGITLATLDLKDAETISQLWPHRDPEAMNRTRRLIQYNVSVGAYDGTGKLIAWCLRHTNGSLGLLQVLESHRRLGLGSLMVRYLSKTISALGDVVQAPVVPENIPSRKMFEKLGFQSIDKIHWSLQK